MVLCTVGIIMYTVYALEGPSTDHICIGQRKNMEITIFFYCIINKIP